jgi:hypothetical protein
MFAAWMVLGSGRVRGEDLRLNQIQVIGTHNSYHVAPAPAVMGIVALAGKERAAGLEYSHRPLREQLQHLGIRQIELDVFADPEGGRFASPYGRKVAATQGKDAGADPNAEGRLSKPGFKVLHVPDVDFLSTVPTFIDGLKQIRDWSRANPGHVPILILVELKDDAIPGLPTKPVKFDAKLLDAVDAEIRTVFKSGEVITPDQLRGDDETLSGAIRRRGWPPLAAVRGKIIFALDNEGSLRDQYLSGHPSLRNRMMLASVAENDPAAAWIKVNDAVKDFDRIQRLVRGGFLVRTRADADTREARRNDGSRRDKALASGAQFVSTDYPEPNPMFSPYQVRLPGNVVARRNPVNAPGNPKCGDVESGDAK